MALHAIFSAFRKEGVKLHHTRRRAVRRNPKWWSDVEVRDAATMSHREMTLDEAIASMQRQYGQERAPSRSSLHRYWLKLDKTRGER